MSKLYKRELNKNKRLEFINKYKIGGVFINELLNLNVNDWKDLKRQVSGQYVFYKNHYYKNLGRCLFNYEISEKLILYIEKTYIQKYTDNWKKKNLRIKNKLDEVETFNKNHSKRMREIFLKEKDHKNKNK